MIIVLYILCFVLGFVLTEIFYQYQSVQERIAVALENMNLTRKHIDGIIQEAS